MLTKRGSQKRENRNRNPRRDGGVQKLQASSFDHDNYRFQHPTLKWVETQTVATVNQTSSTFLLNWPANGTGYQARASNVIQIPKITFTCSLAPSVTGFNNVRLMLVQQVGPLYAMSIGDILLPTGAGLVPESQMIPGIEKKVHILYDEVFDLNTYGSQAIVTLFRTIRPTQTIIPFEANSLVVQSGSLLLYAIAGPGTVTVDMNGQAFLWFAD